MPSKRHSRKSHSRKRKHRMRRKSRAYGRRRRSMYGGDNNVYWVEGFNDDSALVKLIALGYVFKGTEALYPNQYMTTSKFVDIIDKHFASPNRINIDGYHMFVNNRNSLDYAYKVELHEGDAMIGQVTLTKIPVSAEPTAKTLPGYNYELRNSDDL